MTGSAHGHTSVNHADVSVMIYHDTGRYSVLYTSVDIVYTSVNIVFTSVNIVYTSVDIVYTSVDL